MPERVTHSAFDRIGTDNTAGYSQVGASPDFADADKKAGHIAGDPFNESAILVGVQHGLADKPGLMPAARALSLYGEHALGWISVGAVAALVDKTRRRDWVGMIVTAVSAHAASVILKRIVRRLRPHDERIVIGVSTPSRLSFPSSHATSTAAALSAASTITGRRSLLAGIPVMCLARMLVGVHYPTDVTAGALLGLAFGRVFARLRRH